MSDTKVLSLSIKISTQVNIENEIPVNQILNFRKILTIKKSSWNFSDSIAGNLLKRLETCLSNEFSEGISPAFAVGKQL